MDLNNRPLFMLHDRHPDIVGAKQLTSAEAPAWNKRGYGIFWVINDFKDNRVESNLTKVNAWFFEIDDKPKHYQLALIEKGLIPSLIVESKNSFHTYFFANTNAKDGFEDIQRRLIHYYESDNKIKDPLRLMRAPGFNHMKDPDDPFPCEIVWHRPITYTAKVMRYFYPAEEKEEAAPKPRMKVTKDENDFFQMLYALDHRRVLEQFSGTSWVNGEIYSFKQQRSGRINIQVNNRNTHCFIDPQGRIGACGGGPTIWQWLKWFNHDGKAIRRAINEVLGC